MPDLGGLVLSLAVAAGPTGEPIHLSLVTESVLEPVWMTAAPGDMQRVFVVDQFDNDAVGRIRVMRGDAVVETPYLELGPVATNNSTGVLCLAFHPEYADNGHAFVFYCDAGGDVVISRFTVSGNPDVADPDSEQVILTIPQPHHIHQGGWLGFGPDGYLYVSAGDGGDAEDPDRRGQDPGSMLGKMLRLDVSGDDFPADPLRHYAIPPDNPFVGETPLDEIWALGLREVWRASFDRGTGELFMADVGQEGWEEIDVEPFGFAGGANYGWRCREGAHALFDDPECDDATFTDPVYEYPHSGELGGCAVIGGYVYRGGAIPNLAGRYVFADHCTNRVFSFVHQAGRAGDFVEHPVILVSPGDSPGVEPGSITSFGEDACGELYLATRQGQIFRIVSGDGTPGVCECPWDVDGNGNVGASDFLTLLGLWGTSPGGAPDFDGSGDVGVTDLLALLGAWGQCP